MSQPRSIFGRHLRFFLYKNPWCEGVIFVDHEGEIVDSASDTSDESELRLIGAHAEIIRRLITNRWKNVGFSQPVQITICTTVRRIIISDVIVPYCLVAVFSPDSPEGSMSRAVSQLARRIASEI